MATTFIGEIRMFAFNFAPKGWAACNGQLLAIAQNQALFSILGTTYGGNGQTTFALPNLQGKVPIHWGNGGGFNPVLGQTAGEQSHTLLTTEMPQHIHSLVALTGPPAARSFGGNQLSVPTFNMYGPSPIAGTMDPGSIGLQGGNQPHNNMQPYQVQNTCICLVGFFPSRN